MIFGNKSPVSRIGRVVTVVAHHPEIVHFEGVLFGHCSVDVNFSVLHLQLILFVDTDDSLVKRKILGRQLNGDTLFGNPYWTKVVQIPGKLVITGEDIGIVVLFWPGNPLLTGDEFHGIQYLEFLGSK